MIESAILLQIDATIIAGAIVLLTITSFVGKDHEPIGIRIWKNHGLAFTPHQVASGAIITFGVSSLYILFSLPNTIEESFAYLTAAIGFVWLILSGIVIAGKEQFNAWSKS